MTAVEVCAAIYGVIAIISAIHIGGVALCQIFREENPEFTSLLKYGVSIAVIGAIWPVSWSYILYHIWHDREE